jgi:protease I
VTDALAGRRILAIATSYGVEQDELVVPVEHLREQGATVVVAAPSMDPIQTLVGDKEPGQSLQPDTTFDDAGTEFDLLLVPGGTLNADALRLESAALAIVVAGASSGRPIAAICHGPWALVEAGVVDGKTLTSYPSLRTDLRNAGATWVDQPVSVDDAGGYTLITSRTPADLDDFLHAIDQALARVTTAGAR